MPDQLWVARGPAAGRTSTGMPVRWAMPETRSRRSGPSAASRLTLTPLVFNTTRQAAGVLVAPAVRHRHRSGHEVVEQAHRQADGGGVGRDVGKVAVREAGAGRVVRVDVEIVGVATAGDERRGRCAFTGCGC